MSGGGMLGGSLYYSALLLVTLSVIIQHSHGDRPKRNDALKVVSILDPPFLMYRKGANRTAAGNKRYEGFIPDLLREIEHVTGREYEIYLSPDGQYGDQDKDGVWNGMVGEVITGAADVAAAPLTITYKRSKVVDFSVPIMTTGVQVLYKKPERSTASITMFSPLAAEVWICIIGIFILSGGGLYLIQRCVPTANKTEEGNNDSELCKLGDSFWILIRSFTLQGFEGSSVPSWSGRVLMGSWLLFSFFTLIMYGAILITWIPAIIGGVLQRLPFSDVNTLLDSGIKFGCVNAGSTKSFFRMSSVSTYSKMYLRMESDRSFVKTVQEGIQKSQAGGFAFLGESQVLEYAASRKPCNLLVVGPQITSNAYGLAIKTGSNLKADLDQAILQLRETGTIKRLKNKWWYDVSACPPPSEAIVEALGSGESDGKVSKLELKGFLSSGPVLIFGVGLFLAVLAAGMEVVWSKRSSIASSSNSTPKAEVA